jgi:hypothetical protein
LKKWSSPKGCRAIDNSYNYGGYDEQNMWIGCACMNAYRMRENPLERRSLRRRRYNNIQMVLTEDTKVIGIVQDRVQ